MRRDEEYVGKSVMRMDVDGDEKERKIEVEMDGQDRVNVDLREKGLWGGDA